MAPSTDGLRARARKESRKEKNQPELADPRSCVVSRWLVRHAQLSQRELHDESNVCCSERARTKQVSNAVIFNSSCSSLHQRKFDSDQRSAKSNMDSSLILGGEPGSLLVVRQEPCNFSSKAGELGETGGFVTFFPAPADGRLVWWAGRPAVSLRSSMGSDLAARAGTTVPSPL